MDSHTIFEQCMEELNTKSLFKLCMKELLIDTPTDDSIYEITYPNGLTMAYFITSEPNEVKICMWSIDKINGHYQVKCGHLSDYLDENIIIKKIFTTYKGRDIADINKNFLNDSGFVSYDSDDSDYFEGFEIEIESYSDEEKESVETVSHLHDAMSNLDIVKDKLTDNEYKKLVESLGKIYNDIK